MRPKLKVSDDPDKTTNPGVKKIIRFYDEKNFMRGDLIIFEEESLPSGKPIKAFHPILPHVSKTYPEQFRRRKFSFPFFKAGQLVYPLPRLQDIQKKTLESLSHLRPSTSASRTRTFTT